MEMLNTLGLNQGSNSDPYLIGKQILPQKFQCRSFSSFHWGSQHLVFLFKLLLFGSCDFMRFSLLCVNKRILQRNVWTSDQSVLLWKGGQITCIVKGEVHIKAPTVNAVCHDFWVWMPDWSYIYVFGAANLQGPPEVNGTTSRCNCSPVKVKHSESGLRGLTYFQ